MKKVFSILSIIAAMAMLSCNSHSKKEIKNSDSDSLSSKKAVVYYFHGDRRCKTCIAVGDIAQKTVAETFKGNTNVAFSEVNTDKKENAAIVEKFQVSGSSLMLRFNSKDKETVEDMTDFAFMNALTNPDTLRSSITAKINAHL